MRKIYGTLGTLGLVGVTVAAMVLQACETAPHAKRSTNNNYGLGTTAQAQPTPPSNWSPIGRQQDSNGLSRALPSAGGYVFGESNSPDYRDVPSIDLRQALQMNQGGGGGAQSPFLNKQLGYAQLSLDSADAAVPPALDPSTYPKDWPEQGGSGIQQSAATTEAQQKLIEAYRREVARREAELPPPKTEITLRPGQELWVIERTHPKIVQPADDIPGCGSLMTRREESGQWRNVPVPLAHTDVSAHVDGYISTVKVSQKFHNPYDSKIEALYVFPLPEDAAVNDFLMTVGSRTIRGVIREREEAEKIYENARRRGYVASIMP